jgi:hypothetical protein
MAVPLTGDNQRVTFLTASLVLRPRVMHHDPPPPEEWMDYEMEELARSHAPASYVFCSKNIHSSILFAYFSIVLCFKSQNSKITLYSIDYANMCMN